MDPIGVVTVGFSLAKALNTYISDVKDANDDITSLISDIEATLGQLNDLVKLIEKNKTTKAWSEDGLKNAKKCVTDCEKIITKLRALLQKSTASATARELNRDDIDVSKLERAFWPFNKPQMEVRRKELQRIKQDIMIAYSSYMTQIGPDAERKKFKDDLPRLKETRAIARRQVREAKKKRRRRPSDPHAPRASRSDDDRSSTSDDSRHVYYDEDDLESLFEGWKAEEEEKKVYAKAEREFLQEEAVKAWKEQQLHEAKARQQRIDNERSSLRTELKQQNLAPQQIEDIVNHIHPHDMKSDAHILNRAIASDNASSTTTNDTPAKPTLSKSCRGSKWLKKKSTSSRHSSEGATIINESQETPVPGILKDPTAEGGIAPLEARYFQRSGHALDGIYNFSVGIPGPWLIDSLIKRQDITAHDLKKFNSVWQEYSLLPDDYQFSISNYITAKLADPGKETTTWVLLHLERMPKKRHRGIFNRGNRGEVVGVYVVLKQNKRRNHGDGLKDDDSHTKRVQDHPVSEHFATREPSRRQNSNDIPAQRDHTSSGFDARQNSFRHSTRETTSSRPQRLEPNGGYREGLDSYPQPPFATVYPGRPRRHPPDSSYDHARTYDSVGPWLYPQPIPVTENLVPPAPFMAPIDLTLRNRIPSPSRRRDHFRSSDRSPPSRRRAKHKSSRSLSPSPRRLRRTGTDESRRSVDSTASATRIRRPLRDGHRREIMIRPSRPPLSAISESHDSSTDVSDTSISSVASDIDDKSDPPRDPSRERLRDRTLEGRIEILSEDGVAHPGSPTSTIEDVEKSGASPHATTNGHEDGTISKALVLKTDA